MSRYFSLSLAAILLSTAPLLQASPPPSESTAAPAAGTHAPAQPGAKPASIELGKVNVTAMRRMIETLEQVKVALKRPFDDDPKHVDHMVCRLHLAAFVNTEAELECGNQGWFSSRRDLTQRALAGGGGFAQALNANWEATNGPTSEYGHRWHSTRTLTRSQLVFFRQLLKALPAPGTGKVVIVDKNGKAVMTIKPEEPSGTHGLN